jgi:hypothetical protein
MSQVIQLRPNRLSSITVAYFGQSINSSFDKHCGEDSERVWMLSFVRIDILTQCIVRSRAV